MSTVIVWISKALALAIHERQLAEHGGGSGVRDDGLLDSALARRNSCTRTVSRRRTWPG